MQLYNHRTSFIYSTFLEDGIFGKMETEDSINLKIISGVYWDQGAGEMNQDSVALQQVMTSKGRIMMAVVSDGIGGLKEGETASGYITERLIENFYHQMVPLAGRGKGREALKKSVLRCFYDINENLKRYGKGKDILLGATISLLFVWGRRYMIMHLGDSRIYRYHSSKFYKGRIRQLTNDHSDGSSRLMKCMGSFPFQFPDIVFGRLFGKNGFLLCTDGFYRKMSNEIFRVLAPEDVESDEQVYIRLKEIGAEILKRGEKDNLSAVYAVVG